MNHYLHRCFLLFLICSGTALADSDNYWQCTLRDATKQVWQTRNIYRQMAVIQSLAECKKASTIPRSCRLNAMSCEHFISGVSSNPLWRCVALDRTATAWPSDFSNSRIQAAFSAKDFCKQRSIVPETCYLNFVTCATQNELR